MKEKYKILDLFSGIGGFSLGLERTGHFKTVAFCEIDKFCKLILDKHWKGTKIYNNVKEITKERLEADGIQLPDIITGGFPCQPFSVAGKQKGTSDDRHLWPEMFRIIQEFTPRWVVGENVKGITNIQDGMVFETVCTDLEGAGYEVRTFNIPVAGVGAPHRRERMWIVANSQCPVGGSNLPGIKKALDQGHLKRPSGQPIQIRLRGGSGRNDYGRHRRRTRPQTGAQNTNREEHR
ncbi:DNA cytosine methyltransferase [Pseudomonas sp. GNP014]